MGYPLTYLYFAGFVVLVVIATAAAMVMPAQPAKRWTVASLVLCAIWSFADFVSNLATTAAELELLSHLLSPAWALLPFTTLQAAAHHAGARRWTHGLTQAALALPAAAAMWLALSHQLFTGWTPASATGGYFVVDSTGWQLLVDLYFIAFFGTGAGLLAAAARRTGLRAFRRPAKTYAFVFGPAVLVASGFEPIMRSFGRPPVHVASVVVSLVAVVVGIRLLRDQFFVPLTRLRRRAEDAVRASDDRYRLLLETSPDAVGLTDEHGRLIRVNVATARLFGFEDAEQLMTATPQIWQLFVAADRQSARAAAARVMHAGTVYGVALTGVRRDGTPFPLEVSASVLPASGEHGPTFIFSARDVSERLQATHEKQELTERVLHAQKLESLGLLAAGIAHDFNNVLLSSLANAGLAKKRLPSDAPARPFLDAVEEAAHVGAQLTRQLLTYAGRTKRTLEPVNLSSLSRDLTELLGVSIGGDVEIELELQDDLPLIDGDVGQLQQVIMNLLTNAAEAIGDGPGRVSVRTSCVDVPAEELRDHTGRWIAPGRYVRLEVVDTGAGIAPEHRHRIFDPFFTTKPTGHGLGLAAVLGIVQGHGGLLTLDSDTERGTRFGMLLPLPSERPAAEVCATQPGYGARS